MPETQKVQVDKLTKLLELHKELIGKFAAVNDEMAALLGGGAGIGAAMKAVTDCWEILWCNRYAPGRTKGYVWNGGRDFPQMKKMVKALGAQEIKDRIGRYLMNNDPFFANARHSFGAFIMSINQHAKESAPAAPTELELEAPCVPGCKHNPPCQSDQTHTKRRTREMRGEA